MHLLRIMHSSTLWGVPDLTSHVETLNSHVMAEHAERSLLKGGYECIFVEEPPEHLQTECSVCLCLLKDPHLIDCECGASFCRTCIEPILNEEAGKACPLCKGPFTTSMPDHRLQQTLSNLKVYCSNRKASCEWLDSLGKLQLHLNVAADKDGQSDKFCG